MTPASYSFDDTIDKSLTKFVRGLYSHNIVSHKSNAATCSLLEVDFKHLKIAGKLFAPLYSRRQIT